MAAQREAPHQAQGGGRALGEGLCMLMLQAVLARNQSPHWDLPIMQCGWRAESAWTMEWRLGGREQPDSTEHLGFYPECM